MNTQPTGSVKFGDAARLAAIQLLKTQKFRSAFRQSLRGQLEAWLNDPAPKYKSPFSPRQLNNLQLHTHSQAYEKHQDSPRSSIL